MPTWNDPQTWVVGQVLTAEDMNLQMRDNFRILSTHKHSGDPGDGASAIGLLQTADFEAVATPAAPGSGRARLFANATGRPGWRDGNGAAEQLASLQAAETLENKTLTNPTIDDFRNAHHDHSSGNEGGIVDAGLTFRGADLVERSTNSNSLVTLSNVTGLSIASTDFIIIYVILGSAADTSAAIFAIRLNGGTDAVSFRTNNINTGIFSPPKVVKIIIPPRTTSYLGSGMVEIPFYSQFFIGFFFLDPDHVPTDLIESIAIRGSGTTNINTFSHRMQVYTLGT